MKILLLTDFFPTGKNLTFSGGVEARTFFVAKYLSKTNKVNVICSKQPNSPKEENMFGFKVNRVGPTLGYASGAPTYLDFLKRIKFIFDAISFGKKLDVDIVDGGNFNGHFIARQIASSKKIPCVYWYPDVFIDQWVKTSGVLGGLGGWLLEKINLTRSADHFIAISDVTKKKLLEQGVGENKMTKIPCGVEVKEFEMKVKKANPSTIISISRLVGYKNIKDLLLAFALLLKKGYILKLKIIGSGPKKRELIRLAKAIKILHNTQFIENLPRKRLILELKSSKIFCLPSSVEGFGISVIEAAAARIPYVISNIKVFKEITKNGKGGLIFKLGDICDLANNVERFLKDENLYSQKHKELKELTKLYNWKDISNETLKVYKILVNDY